MYKEEIILVNFFLFSFKNLKDVYLKFFKWFFFSNNDSFISTLSDEEILEDMGKDDLMVFQMMSSTTCNSNEFFISHKMNEWMGQSMDPIVGV